MFVARVIARFPGGFCTSAAQSLKSIQPNPSGLARVNFTLRCQQYANQSRIGAKRVAKTRTLKEILQSPTTGSAATMGKCLLIGASTVGIGAICYYGSCLSNEVGEIERTVIWPQYVRDRVRTTYMYFGMGLATTTASALAMARSLSPALLMKIAPKSKTGAYVYTAVVVTSVVVTMLVPYSEGMGLKQLVWLGHSGLLGVVLAPICSMGGPILIKAACYTAGAVGGLSCVAMCAPSDKFLYIGGALAMGLGAVFAASVGSMFLAPALALGSGLYAVSLYGGIGIVWGFMLYDTHMIMERCESYPRDDEQHFDPIKSALGIFIDTAFMFIYIVNLLVNGEGDGGRGGGVDVGIGGGGGGKTESDQTSESGERSRFRKPKTRFWKKSSERRKKDKKKRKES